MSISPERSIAVKIIAPFRKCVDKYLYPQKDEEMVKGKDIDGYIESAFNLSIDDLPKDLITAMKKTLSKMNDSLYDSQILAYDKVMIAIVDFTMKKLEDHLTKTYTPEELTYLSGIVNDERFGLFINDDMLLNILFNGFTKVGDSLEEEMYAFLGDESNFASSEIMSLLEGFDKDDL